MPLLNPNSLLTNPLAMAGIGLLSQPTRSRYPLNPMAAVMGGIQSAGQYQQQQAQTAGQQQELQLRQQRLQMEMDAALRQREQEAMAAAEKVRHDKAIEDAISKLPPEQQAIARLNPGAYATAATKAAFETPKETSTVQNYNMAVKQGYQGSFVDYQTMLANARKPSVTVNNAGQPQLKATDSGMVAITPQPDGSWKTEVVVPKKPTEGQAAAGSYADRMQEASARAGQIEAQSGFDPTNLSQNLASRVPVAGNFAMTPEFQQYQQAKEDWVRAKLRKESGAVIAKEEMQKEFETYWPQPGDSQEVIAAKARARQIAEQGMANQAGPANPDKGKKVRRYNPQTGMIE